METLTKPMNDLVTIYMQVYNTKKFLRRAIDSVLNQTYHNIEFILVDNGCTDGCSEIIKEYAEKDSRVIYIHYEENQQYFFESLLEQYATGRYFTLLDSDDWLESNFLELMVGFAQASKLDIVSTGSIMHHPNGYEEKRPSFSLDRMVLEKKDFAKYLPYYHWCLRANWGNLFSMEIIKSVKDLAKLSYGRDTLYSFQYLRKANRIGLLGRWLHHYQLHFKSSSYNYTPDRFEADVVLWDDLMDFLAAYGELSQQNKDFAYSIYANALLDTMSVISNSKLTVKKKFEEYCRIAKHPATKRCYQEGGQAVAVSRSVLIENLFAFYSQNNDKKAFDILHSVLKEYCPNCSKILNAKNLSFFMNEALDLFVKDDMDKIVQHLFELVEDKKQTSQYLHVLWDITKDQGVLRDIDSLFLLKNYTVIYRDVFNGNYVDALEKMTDLLMDNAVKHKKDQFLLLYLRVSALLQYEPAYVFGKVQLGYFYLQNSNKTEALRVAQELINMQVSDVDNVKQFLLEVGVI